MRKTKPKVKKPWTPNGYIFAALRRIFRWSPERRKALNDAENKGKFVCAECKRDFDREGVAVDHREPVVSPIQGFQGWDCYVDRLFTTASNLQVLCRDCHKAKTKLEGVIRRAAKANKTLKDGKA